MPASKHTLREGVHKDKQGVQMSTYCVYDIHGEYEKYLALLSKIPFSENDTLYVIGSMIDRGSQPLALVRDIMRRPNVIAPAGSHDVLAALLLPHLLYGGRAEEPDDKTRADIFLWMQDGAESTIKTSAACPSPSVQS